MSKLNNLFKFGTVVSVDDNSDGGRIKVHVRGEDPVNYEIDNIPYAFPLLPKTIHVNPKVGEFVFVFTQSGDYTDDRYWMGPIISQTDKMAYDSITALSFLNAGNVNPTVAPSTIPENKGVSMDKDDIGFYGRGNADIMLKPSEVRIRAGKSHDLKHYNRENLSYIQVKHNNIKKEGAINIVSDNINLLSHKSINKYHLTDPDKLITDGEYKHIIETAHQLPYGDILIELLEILIKAFSSHVHAYHGLPPDINQNEIVKLLQFDMEKILSKNIRIN